MSSKQVLGGLVLVGTLGMVYGLSTRLSAEAFNVIVGLLCGLSATVPISVGLVIALTRQRRRARSDPNEEYEDYAPAGYEHQPYRQPYPPVIVVAPPQASAPYSWGNLLPPGSVAPGYNMQEPPGGRDFKIIGDDDAWDA